MPQKPLTFERVGDVPKPPTTEDAPLTFEPVVEVKPPSEKSIGGFLANVMSSGGRFIRDSVTGAVDLAKFVGKYGPSGSATPEERAQAGQQFIQLVKNSPEVASQLYGALKNRYGSGEAIIETLYKDPVGVMADLSTVAGAGAIATGARLPRATKVLSNIERATNPASVVAGTTPRTPYRLPHPLGAPGQGQPNWTKSRKLPGLADGLQLASDLAITATVRPTAPVKKMAGGARPATNREIAAHIKKNRVISSEQAERKIKQTQGQIDTLLASDDYGFLRPAETPLFGEGGLNGQTIVDLVRNDVDPEILRLSDIGIDERPLRKRLNDRIHELSNTRLVDVSLPKQMDIYDALDAKRKAQSRAYDHAPGESFDAAIDKAVAQAYKKATEHMVAQKRPGERALASLNEKEQSQLIAKKALGVAEDRAGGLSNMLALPTLGTSLFLDSPRIGSAVGIGLDAIGKGVSFTPAQQAALVARQEELFRQAILEALAEKQEEQE